MPLIALLILLSLATYRVGRFIILDTLIDTPRLWLYGKILYRPTALRRKLHELLTCAYCVTFWIAGLLVGAVDLFSSVPLPFLMWPAAAAGSFIPWKYVDPA